MSVADRASAAASIDEDGQVFTLTYPVAATYDPATSEATGSALSDQQVAGVILPLSPFRKSGNSNIVEGDQQCLLSALNTAGVVIASPKVNGTLKNANEKRWTIIAVDPLSPADIDIMFDLVVRRAA